MTRPLIIAAAAVGFGLGAWLAYGVVDRTFLTPRSELREKIDSLRDRVNAAQKIVDSGPGLRTEIEDCSRHTLGPSLEVVDHRLRTRLNRIAEEVGLADPSVGTGAVAHRPSPARRAFRGDLRDELDFSEVEGWVSGQGTLEQIVQIIDRIEAEPWIKRIHQVRLDPRDNGELIQATVRLTTLFLPGRGPNEVTVEAYDAARLASYASLVETNPFRLPPPEVAPPQPQVETTPEPQRFPWAQWMVTGVAAGPGGPEAWMSNRESGETSVLQVGDTLGAAELIDARGEWAEFRIDDSSFRVQVGHRMNDRSPVKRE